MAARKLNNRITEIQRVYLTLRKPIEAKRSSSERRGMLMHLYLHTCTILGSGTGSTTDSHSGLIFLDLQCQICRASFMCTASAVKLQEHVDSKHSKNGFEVSVWLLAVSAGCR